MVKVKSWLQQIGQDPLRLSGVLGILATLSLLLWQGSPYLFDWDELIYASLARHMLATGNWLDLAINGAPFWEKPPLFFWLQSLSMSVHTLWTGSLDPIPETLARLPNAIVGGLTIAGLVWLGARVRSTLFACLWVLLLSTSLLPLLFAKTGLIDPLLNLCILVGLGGLFAAEQARLQQLQGTKPLVIAAVALGFAVLAKGPLGLGLPLIIWIVYKGWHPRPWPRWQDLGLFAGVSLAVACSWFALEWIAQGPEFVWEFIRYQWRILTSHDGHPGPVYFHLLAYGLGCFPFAALTVAGWWQIRHQSEPYSPSQRLDRLVTVAFVTVLLLFSLVVQTKLVHYTALLYPFGSYFAALRLQMLWLRNPPPRWLEMGWILLTGLLLSAVLLLVPWIGQHPQSLQRWISDPLALGYLQAGVQWPGYTYAPGAILLLGLVIWWGGALNYQQRRGWWVLLLSTWISTQLTWGWLAPRVFDHTQGGAVRFFQQVAREEITASADNGFPDPVALFGFRSFIPYFYGPLRVPYTADLQELIPWVIQQQVRYVVSWIPFEAELVETLPLRVVQRSGAFIVLENTPIPEE